MEHQLQIISSVYLCMQQTIALHVHTRYGYIILWFPSHIRFGDRIMSVEGRGFENVTRKEAIEVLRSCDQLSMTVEVARALSYSKPQSLVCGLTVLMKLS